MSVIWRAFDQSLQRVVAIKVLDGSLDDDNPGRELMRREARATARLIHPDAIEVYDYGETVTNGGRLASFVVMRLLEGRSLADRIVEGPLPWAEAVEIATGLAKVLTAAHDRGIVHRDVTPENVLLAEDGPKLLDFGIAAFVGDADDHLVADFGTPPYVAPERLKGTTADPAVDVYALGVLLFEMLTGALPYPEKTWEAIEAARREGPPPSPEGVPGLPQEVADLCRRCLCPDPVDRPSARAVAAALATMNKPPGPRGAGWGAAAVGAAALGGILWFTQTHGPEVAAVTVPASPSPTLTQTVISPPPQVEAIAVPRHTVAPVADPVSTAAPARRHPLPRSASRPSRRIGTPGTPSGGRRPRPPPSPTWRRCRWPSRPHRCGSTPLSGSSTCSRTARRPPTTSTTTSRSTSNRCCATPSAAVRGCPASAQRSRSAIRRDGCPPR
ncbi:hypothetical protein GCM10027612_28240 [Microbispora bryophytorum subsp. camponoti]